jgi:hypothetical protein
MAANPDDGSLSHLGKGVRWYIVDVSTLFAPTTTRSHRVETIEWTARYWSDRKAVGREMKSLPSDEG